MNVSSPAVKVLVIGAAGELGRLVCDGLAARGIAVRAFVRREGAGRGGDVFVGDLADAASIAAACAGVDRMFLVSSPTREQVVLETNAITAAERAGVERIVKISNIPIVGLDTGLHGSHRAIERRLAASPVAGVVLQPSFFTSVIDKQRDLIAHGKLVLPTGAGRIAWIDPRDIGAVAVEALVRDDLGSPLHLTGPAALDGDEVAARLGVRRLDPPLPEWRSAAVAGGLDPWLADSTVHLYAAVARGALSDVTGTVARVLGRAPFDPFVS